jgi:hypothetical protein
LHDLRKVSAPWRMTPWTSGRNAADGATARND